MGISYVGASKKNIRAHACCLYAHSACVLVLALHAGGFVSPMGISYVGASKEKLGEAACCAVKRINLDNRVAKKAKSAGADLKEGFEVGCYVIMLCYCVVFVFVDLG
jgi:hypothetical protein